MIIIVTKAQPGFKGCEYLDNGYISNICNESLIKLPERKIREIIKK
jgi:hypothetical protein